MASKRKAVLVPVDEAELALIDAAARETGVSRVDFVRLAARQHAEAILALRERFGLDEASFDRYLTILNGPPAPEILLRELLRRPTPWEKG